jgi:hypothetical protein
MIRWLIAIFPIIVRLLYFHEPRGSCMKYQAGQLVLNLRRSAKNVSHDITSDDIELDESSGGGGRDRQLTSAFEVGIPGLRSVDTESV